MRFVGTSDPWSDRARRNCPFPLFCLDGRLTKDFPSVRIHLILRDRRLSYELGLTIQSTCGSISLRFSLQGMHFIAAKTRSLYCHEVSDQRAMQSSKVLPYSNLWRRVAAPRTASISVGLAMSSTQAANLISSACLCIRTRPYPPRSRTEECSSCLGTLLEVSLRMLAPENSKAPVPLTFSQ